MNEKELRDQLFLQVMQNCPHSISDDKLEEFVKGASQKADFIYDLYKGLNKKNPTKQNENK